ncbi:MAG: Holliday junction branch migration protein RuvA [Chloroflexi bacterium]|nr:Holliday junction branch migration protein RuvA [Chloroflexota bacterium]
MIASLRGKVETLGGDWVVVEVGGVGYHVYMPLSTLNKLGSIGSDIKLYTHFHLREDSATLFGFATIEELNLFQTLTGVSGLGPKLAMAMLSAMSVEQLTIGIAAGSTELLISIPGIGKKMAQRLILELKEKVSGGTFISAEAVPTEGNGEVLSALTSLGYSPAEAARAVANLPKDSNELSLEERIKLTLGQFGE